MANHRIIDRDSAHLDPVQHYHVARFIRGGTNQSVILPRRGPETFQPRVMYWVACACLGLFVVCDNPPASSKPASSQCLRVALTYYAAHCPSSFPGCRRVSKAAAEKRWQRNFNALKSSVCQWMNRRSCFFRRSPDADWSSSMKFLGCVTFMVI